MLTFANTSVVIALYFVAVVAGLLVREAVKLRRTEIHGWPAAIRADHRAWFWLCVAFQTSIGALCFWFAVRGTIGLLS